jgi:hypothetical protein
LLLCCLPAPPCLAAEGATGDGPTVLRPQSFGHRKIGAACTIEQPAKSRSVTAIKLAALTRDAKALRKGSDICTPALRFATAQPWLELGQQKRGHACPSIASELARTPESSAVDEYLCGVYWRMPRKIDDAGDFTWKDAAAAARVDRTVCEYAIQGMHRDLREQLYALGTQADEAGINWSFLAAFRDDYRQTIATGFKAQSCRSLHGGSCRTEGWGDGQAADLWIANESGEPASDAGPLLGLIDRVGASLGLSRPMRGADPPHVQVAGEWKAIAERLRAKRLGISASANNASETDAANVT